MPLETSLVATAEEVEVDSTYLAVDDFKIPEPKVHKLPEMTLFSPKIVAGTRIQVVANCAFLMDYSVKKVSQDSRFITLKKIDIRKLEPYSNIQRSANRPGT